MELCGDDPLVNMIHENGMGAALDDNGFVDCPSDPGFYKADVTFHFFRGQDTPNGPREDDWEFWLDNTQVLAKLPEWAMNLSGQ